MKKMRPIRTQGKARKVWVLTRARRDSIIEARRQLQILISIGKKYRNKEISRFKVK